MALNKINISNEMGRGWALFQQNMGLLIVTGVLVTLLSGVTFGILAGPLTVGFLLMIRRLLRNDPAAVQVGDVFKGFEYFAQSLILMVIGFVASVVLWFIPLLGQIAAVVIGAILIWGLMLIAYQRLGAIDALKRIFGLLQQGEFAMPLLFGVLAGIVSGVGVIACLIGVFFTMPIGYCMLVCAHETLFGAGETIDVTATETPPANEAR
jgi:hypothetical protein